MSLNLRVHEYRRIPNTNQGRLVKVNPYIRLSHQGEPPMYLQNGCVFAEEAEKPLAEDDIPGWVKERIELLPPEGRAKVGFATAADKKAAKKARAARRGQNLAASLIDDDEEGDEDD